MSYVLPPEFGPFIKEFLRSRHVSEYTAAQKTGITKRTIERWEKGAVQRIRDSNLEEFARGFGLTVDEFFKELEAYKESIASDTVQAASSPSNDDIPVPPAAPPDTTQPVTPPAPAGTQQRPNQEAAPFNTDRGKRLAYYVAAALVVLVMLAIFALSVPSWIQRITTASVTITGTVLCADNERVVGVWVGAINGSSGFAGNYKTNINGSEVRFTYHLTYDLGHSGAYNLHVGCGGSEQDWEHIDITENGSGVVKDHAPHFFTCRDLPLVTGAGSCWLKG